MTAIELKTILDSKTDLGIMKLTDQQLEEIVASKKDIEQGLYVENDDLEKDTIKWLNER